MSDLLFIRVHVDNTEVWVNARRIVTILPTEDGTAILGMNAGPAIVADEDVATILDRLNSFAHASNAVPQRNLTAF